MAAVFVAGKVEESIRRARDIVNVFHHLYCLIRNLPSGPIDYVGDIYYIWRDRLCTMESLLLRELGFHVQPASPVGLLLSYMKILEITENLEVAQMALNYLNDSLKTVAYVLFQPHVLAVSSIALALDRSSLSNELLPSPNDLIAPWYTLFDVNETELIDCKKIIMTVYNRELDILLPLTKEELAIFAGSIKAVEEVEAVVEDNNRNNESQTTRDRDRDNNNSHSYSRDPRHSHSRYNEHSHDNHNGHRSDRYRDEKDYHYRRYN